MTKYIYKLVSSKLAMFILLLLAQVSVASAQKFTLGNVAIDPLDNEEEKEPQYVVVNVENAPEALVAAQFTVSVPEGLSVSVDKTAISGWSEKDNESLSGQTWSLRPASDLLTKRIHSVAVGSPKTDKKTGVSTYPVTITSASNTPFKQANGLLCYLRITASTDFQKTGSIEIDDVEATLSSDHSKQVEGEGDKKSIMIGTAEFGVTESEFEVAPGKTFDVDVTLTLTGEPYIRGFQATLTLPEGLTIEPGDEGLFRYSDRLSDDEIVYNAETGIMVFNSSTDVPILEDEGFLFGFTLKASDKLAEKTTVKLADFVIADRSGSGFELDNDIEIAVTNVAFANDAQYAKDAEAVAAAEKALADAKAAIAKYDQSVQDGVKDALAAAEAAVTAAKAAVEASHSNLTSVKDAEANGKAIADAKAAAEKVAADAAAAQKAYEDAKAANEAQAAKDAEAVAAAEKALADAKDAIAKYDQSVQDGAKDALAAAEKAVADAKAAAEKSKTDGTAVADADANAKAIEAAKAAVEKAAADAAAAQKAWEEAQVEVYSDLTQAMFKHWTAADATGEVEGDVNCSFVLGQSTGLPYGDGNVFYLNYADLSEYATIAVTATAGEPRLLFNRVVDQGTVNVEVPRDAATYETVVDNGDGSKTYTVDIAKIVENFGFAHLHAIKGANWQNTTVTVIKLEKAQLPAFELADGDYLIKNVATGKYLGGANSWGTQASLVESGRIFTATKLENGKYTLDSHTYNNANDHFLGKNGYVDNGDKELTLAAVEGGAAIGKSEEEFFGAPAEGTALAANLKVNDANAVWQFISIADAVKEIEDGTATDATFLLKNASISRNLYNPNFEAVWEGDGFGQGGANDNQNAEKWGGNSQEFDVHQTISLPNGFYKITVNGYYRYNNTTDNTNDIAIAAHADGTEVINTYLYANDAEVALKSIADDEAAAALENLPFSQADATKAFEQGLYLNELYVEVKDAQLTVGVKKIEHPGCDWSVWDNFTITKVESMPEPGKPVPPTIATTKLSTDGSVAQYLYNVEAKGFFLGANDWGTRASISASQGYPVKITVNEDGATYTLNDQRTDGSWHSADCQGVDQIWIDGENRAGDKMWTVAFLNNGSFTLANTYVPEGGNLSVVPSKGDTRLYLSTEDEAQDIWAAVSEEEYAKYVEAYAEYEKELEEYNKKNYKVGDDITNLAPGAWDGQTGSYGGLGRTAYERYSGAGSIEAGDVLTQTLTGLKNGTYEVSLGLAASYTSGRGFECPTGEYRAVAFANGDEEDLEVVDRTWVAGGEEETVDLIAVVTDGTLKYGIKNILKGGNWYVATVNSIKYVSEDAAVPALVDLTTDMFKHWSAADATGEAEGDLNCAYVIGESTGLPYGDGNVYYLNYADLSDCSSIVVVATEGEPRLLFNRVEDQGTVNVEVPRDAATYETVIDNEDGSKTYIVDVAKIVAEYGFAHLHAIKGANWQNTTVTSIQLEKMVTPTYITSIGYTRTAGLGYTAEEVPYNEEEIFNALGVTSWEGVEMYPVVMTAGEIGVDHDGWRNVDGDPAAWTGDGTDLGLCLKYPHDGSFALCTHPNNDPEAGTLLAAAWALKAGEKTATIRVVVEFVAPETVDIEIAENMIQASVEYDNTEASYVEKSVTLSDDDVAAILSELDLESLDDADVYGYNPTTKELVSSFTGYDGWRDANGDFANWSGDSSVPACVKYTDGQTYLCYNINGCDPQTIKTYWAIANDTKAVLVEISFTYTGAVKIADIEKAGSVKNGKFLEDGKVVIYKNGVKFNAAGVMVK